MIIRGRSGIWTHEPLLNDFGFSRPAHSTNSAILPNKKLGFIFCENPLTQYQYDGLQDFPLNKFNVLVFVANNGIEPLTFSHDENVLPLHQDACRVLSIAYYLCHSYFPIYNITL